MKTKIDNTSVILQYADSSGVIHEVDLKSILDGGFPIDLDTEEEMEYLGTFLINPS